MKGKNILYNNGILTLIFALLKIKVGLCVVIWNAGVPKQNGFLIFWSVLLKTSSTPLWPLILTTRPKFQQEIEKKAKEGSLIVVLFWPNQNRSTSHCMAEANNHELGRF